VAELAGKHAVNRVEGHAHEQPQRDDRGERGPGPAAQRGSVQVGDGPPQRQPEAIPELGQRIASARASRQKRSTAFA